MIVRSPIRAWLAALTLAAAAAPQAARADEPGPLPDGRLVGRRVGDFALKDVVDGRVVRLSDLIRLDGPMGPDADPGRRKAVVLAFTGVGCPVGALYEPTLAALARRFEPKGVAFVAINSNARDAVAEVAAQAKEAGRPFPTLKDEGNVVADLNLVERTGEVLLVDATGVLRYRGATDDQYAPGASRPAPTKTYLVDALKAVLAGRPVEVAATPAVGCRIERVEPKLAAGPARRVRPAPPEIVAAYQAIEDRDGAAEVGAVTFAGHVAAILQAKCQSCHRPGQVGPFPLLTYDDARRRSAMIAEVVDDRRMPPWHADPRHGTFENDRSLSPRERATLLAWVEQGAPLGDPAQLPPPRSFADGWQIGTPDVVIEMPEDFVVPAQGTVPYQYFVAQSPFKEDTWVQAIEARPGDRSVVHHIVVLLEDQGKTPESERERLPLSHLVAYAPGDLPSVFPPGSAKLIKAGTHLVFQMHYTPTGAVRRDRSSIGLILAKGPVAREAQTLGAFNEKIRIPAGAGDHPERSSYTFAADAQLVSLFPHMHLRGKSFEYRATYPDGRGEVLLSVPAYDFAWQSVYRLAEPKPMPRGTRIDCLAHFDNSAANPANPDPSVEVRWGEQTFEEMMIGYIDILEDRPASPGAAASAGDR